MPEKRELSQTLQAAFLRLSGDYYSTCVREGDGPYRIEWVGGPIERITGYSQSELLKKGCWLTIVHPDDRSGVSDHLAKLRPGDEGAIRFRIQTPAGEIRWIEDRNLVQVHESEPSGLRLFSVSRDISAAIAALDAEEKSLADLRTLSDAAGDINEAWDEREILDLLGKAALRLAGEGFIILTPRDPVRDVFWVSGIYGLAPRTLAVATRILGRNPLQIEARVQDMDPDDLSRYTTGRMTRLPGLYEFTTRTIPRPLCRMLEKALRIRSIWGAGFARGGHHMGGLTLMSRIDGPPPTLTLLETLVRQTSVVLDRRRAEESRRAMLVEKEVLLREIHHRVKNNMQVVSSLIGLQGRDLRDPVVRDVFREVRNRIRAMAAIHEKLYRSDDLTRVDMAGYVKDLAEHLRASIPTRPERIRLSIAADGVSLEIGTAIPVGLIVNELVTNALKHAFPDDREGRIDILLEEKSGRARRLTVRDDGIGLPPAVDVRESKTLGLEIVRMLTTQIEGRLESRSRGGAEFVIEFPGPAGKA